MQKHLLPALPPRFTAWFESRGWTPRVHQLAMIEAAKDGVSVLLTAPTGGGKTLAGFLPSLIELSTPHLARAKGASLPLPQGERVKRGTLFPLPSEGEGGRSELSEERPGEGVATKRGLHTLYISPLKALAVDVARNLEAPVNEMGLKVRLETRTGDTPAHKRQRQKYDPPDILLSTPEQLALLLATREVETLFANLKCVVLDELHALVTSKRGDLLSLDLARLSTLAPSHRRVGLSATVADPDYLRRYLMPQPLVGDRLARLVVGAKGAQPDLNVLSSEAHIPWSGHSTRHALPEVMNAILTARTALVFVNTRSQAEFVFQELWRLNDANLPIALHHGSLDVGQRRKVEAAMAKGGLRAVVCTSTLDLGIDWGDVDLVIHVGAPKGASRLQQRIGRANHRLDEPSRAILVPSNRFEVLECIAARDAVREGALDGEPPRMGTLDVLAQHVLGSAVAKPFHPDALYAEILTAEPYRGLSRDEFDRIVDFVATGGYALRTYDRFARLRRTPEGLWRIASPMVAQRYRMNVGTIVEAPLVKVRLGRAGRAGRPGGYGGRVLGEMEEYFAEQLSPGDTFLFAGMLLRFEGMQETEVFVTKAKGEEPKIPSWQGGKFPLSTYLADRVRHMLADRDSHKHLPPQIAEWLDLQHYRSLLPAPDDLLVECFPRGGKFYLVCYPFDGRLAHQTLGMLLTRRLERANMRPMGFVASEYSLAVWGLRDLGDFDMDALFAEDMLGDDLDAWLIGSNLLKRTFRDCALIAGLIERRFPGKEKTGRQVTFSSDLIYDVLRQHQPDHILLRAAYMDAATRLLDVGRLSALLKRVRGHIRVKRLDRISPLAVPVMLEIGKEPVYGKANEDLLREASDKIIAEGTGRG